MNKKKQYILLLLLSILLIPYLYIGFYSNPVADDFTYAFKGKNNNLFDLLIGEYLNWNGRYFSNLLVLINPASPENYFLYKLIPTLIILATLFSIFYFFKSLVKKQIANSSILIASLFLLHLYLYQMPIISEGIYWYTGAITYQVGIILIMFYFGLFNKIINNENSLFPKWFLKIGLIIILFLAVGCNEITMLFLLTASLFLIYQIKKIQLKQSSFIWLLLLSVVVFSIIVIAAPGNLVRGSFFTNKHQFIQTITYSTLQTFRFITNWISSLPLILVSVFYIPINKKLSREFLIFKNSFHLTHIQSILALFIVVFLSIFPAYWSTGMMGQHRTVNIGYFLFLIFWFISLTVFYNKYKSILVSFWINKRLKIIMVLMIVLSLIFTKNGYNLYTDIKDSNQIQYNKQMNERYTIIEQASKHDTVYFGTLINTSKTLFVLDINENQNSWQNKGYGIFFDKPDLVILPK